MELKFNSRILILLLFVITNLPLLSGCVGPVVGAGASVATAASQERGLKEATYDFTIKAKIISMWLQQNSLLLINANVSVSEGRVLLTGLVRTRKMRVDAVRLAWRVGGVKEVINEIQIASSNRSSNFARDAWISAELKSKLTLDRRILSINYTIDTVRRRVYLMGIAQNPSELERVINHTRQIKYVRGITSHVIMKNDLNRYLQ